MMELSLCVIDSFIYACLVLAHVRHINNLIEDIGASAKRQLVEIQVLVGILAFNRIKNHQACVNIVVALPESLKVSLALSVIRGSSKEVEKMLLHGIRVTVINLLVPLGLHGHQSLWILLKDRVFYLLGLCGIIIHKVPCVHQGFLCANFL